MTIVLLLLCTGLFLSCKTEDKLVSKIVGGEWEMYDAEAPRGTGVYWDFAKRFSFKNAYVVEMELQTFDLHVRDKVEWEWEDERDEEIIKIVPYYIQDGIIHMEDPAGEVQYYLIKYENGVLVVYYSDKYDPDKKVLKVYYKRKKD